MNRLDVIDRVHAHCGQPDATCPTGLHTPSADELQFTLWADRMRTRGRTPLNAANAVYGAIVALGTPQERAARLRTCYLKATL